MATICDLNGIKTEIINILQSANTVGASPVDLSNGLTDRVEHFLTVNPTFIPIQPSYYPCITTTIVEKSFVNQDIARDQLAAQRRSEITIEVIGALWNNTIVDPEEDPADDDIQTLMENIELVLRSNSTLNGKVTWYLPQGTRYYVAPIQEETHLRAGVLTLRASVFY